MLNLFQHQGGDPGAGGKLDPETSSGRRRGVTRSGVWSDIRSFIFLRAGFGDDPGRIWQHRSGKTRGFTSRYRVDRLVYLESFADMDMAIAREKQLKRWHRQWQINLIEADNPRWDDLAIGLGFERLDGPKPQPKPSC